MEIIVKLKYEERAAVVNLWQLFLSFLYERPYKINFVLIFIQNSVDYLKVSNC